MTDLLVPLYRLPDLPSLAPGLRVRRAMAYETNRIGEFIASEFPKQWEPEAMVAMGTQPMRCFIALRDTTLIGFACYNATFKGFFGPLGVTQTERGSGVGTALLVACLRALQEEGFAYGVIGGVEEALPFYQRTVSAIVIPDSDPGPYCFDLK